MNATIAVIGIVLFCYFVNKTIVNTNMGRNQILIYLALAIICMTLGFWILFSNDVPQKSDKSHSDKKFHLSLGGTFF